MSKLIDHQISARAVVSGVAVSAVRIADAMEEVKRRMVMDVARLIVEKHGEITNISGIGEDAQRYQLDVLVFSRQDFERVVAERARALARDGVLWFAGAP